MGQNDTLKSKLLKDIDTSAWLDLRPHFARDALILVSHDLSLIEVGAAVGADDVDKVSVWLLEKKIHKPTLKEIVLWDKSPSDYEFSFLILSPYVLAQRLLSANNSSLASP